MIGILISCLLFVPSSANILDEGDFVLDDEGIDLTDWVDVDHDNKLEFDIMTYPLQIETKSSLGSDDKVSVRFWGEGSVIGDLTITFGAEPTYSISPCTAIQMKFSSLPEDDIKFWTIKKKDNSLTLECNDVLVLEYVFESSEEAQCSVSWSQDVDSIMFLSVDTASVRFRGVGTDEYESLCANSSCYPRWGNLLKGRRVTANSTCGQESAEEYCLISNDREEIMCDNCDASNIYKQHPPNYMKDRRIKSRTTWWKAENGLDKVTLQLDLETTFQFTHLIMVFYSFRPGAMVIERSTDYGKNWIPYQYFAYDCQKVFGMKERELGEQDEYGVRRHPDEDVICTSKYSFLEPAQGGEVIYKVVRGRPTSNTNRASLRNLLLLTNLRVRFVQLHTLGDDLWDPNDAEAKKRYFYAVEDWVVRGSCFCNGHADLCTPLPGMEGSEMIKNMINGQCECEHNTAGSNCERCKDFHHARPWSPGDPNSGEAHSCKECTCNGHTDRCEFDEQLYAQTGDGGRCMECEHATAGAHCDRCVYGYYQVDGMELGQTDICQPCNCNEAGTTSEICASITEDDVEAGTCICKANVERSAKCDTCKAEHYGLSAENPLGCTACDCDTRGTEGAATTCDIETGQCVCKENVGGQACDVCKEGFFNMRSEDSSGCEVCSCNSTGTETPDQCDPLTGACYCKSGFSGYNCDEIDPGYFVPTVDHWAYEPENSGIIDGDGYRVTDGNSSGTGFLVLPPDSSVTQSTDERGLPGDEDKEVAATLPTGLYDLLISHEPAESDYELVIQLDHLGKYDGTEPHPYQCAVNKNSATPQQAYGSQVITVTVKAGSTVTRVEGLCMDEGSQYDVKLALEDSGTGALKIKDLVITEPLDPDQAYPEDPAKAELYRQYQDLGCPMTEIPGQEISNECYRLKSELEADMSEEDKVDCDTSLCNPSVDIFDFEEDKDNIETGNGSELTVDEGGDVILPPGSSMTVPLNPGTGGLKDLVLSHDPVEKNKQVTVKVTVKHLGSKDGSDPKSFKCNGVLIRPYEVTTFEVPLKKRKQFTTLGEMCLDPNGEYEITIEPVYHDPDAADLVMKEVFVTHPDDGNSAFPDNKKLADLWDEYIAEECPKVAGDRNSDKQECIDLINQINEQIKEDNREKDCSVESCIPYNPVWESGDPVDNLSGGAYIDPENDQLVLPDSEALIELPLDGGDGVTGSITDLVIKHEPVEEPQTVVIQVVRTDSDEPYSCGVLQSVPQTQIVTVTLQPGTEHTVADSFCLDPEGEYEIRISGADLTEPIRINEIGSALPSDPAAAYPENPTAADYYQQYLNEGCKQFPEQNATQECVHLANLVDYHSNPDRQGKPDCTVEFCYPTNDVFSPISPKSGVELDGGRYDESDGGIILGADDKVKMPLDPLMTGPNTIVIEYEEDELSDLLFGPGDYLPDSLEITIIYKGTEDGTNVGEFKCRGETVKPGTRKFTVPLDPTKTSVEFEACLLDNGLYDIEIKLMDEEGNAVKITKIYAELPRDTENLFPDDSEAQDLVDFLVNTCENQVFSAECAAASRGVQEKIDENNDKYKVDCNEELCLPEESIWSKGDDNFLGNIAGVSDSGAIVLSGGKSVVFTFAGSIAPKSGLNSLIFTVNPEVYNRVVDVIITPRGGSKDNTDDYEMCGETSSAKQQLLRKVIQANVAFVEVGPICLDPGLEYDVQMIYQGVQPPNSDRIYAETSGINVIIQSVDVVLPLDPEEAFPDNLEAQKLWEEYVDAQCPRLSAGYSEPEQECLDLLADLHDLIHELDGEECEVTVCIQGDGGWKHDPTSDQEKFEGGASVDGGSSDAIISLPPGGELSLKTGEKEDVENAAENVPYTGIMDLMVNHLKSRYAWDGVVEVTHTKTKGNEKPTAFNCLNGEILPYSTQTFSVRVEPCTTETRIPNVCVGRANTYDIKLTVRERVEPPVECEGATEYEDGFPLDTFGFVFPENPEVAFPDNEELQDLYQEYLDQDCGSRRNKACDELDVAIIASLIGEAVGCGCNMGRSLSGDCDSVGGQCPCKEGYTGRTCGLCLPTYFGILSQGLCSPCDCNSYGSKSDICDMETGQCPCHEGVLTSADINGLTTCSQCVDGYVGLESTGTEGCVACQCGVGAALSTCDEATASCSCLPGVAGPLCEHCSTGFYNLIEGAGCQECECNPAGSAELGCEQTSGECNCKENVIGTRCDSCKANSFSIREDNPAGCTRCYCNGVSDECSAAKGWTIKNKVLELNWGVIGGAQEVRPKYVIGAVSGTEFVWEASDIGDFYTSYGMDLTVNLNGYEDLEVLIRLYRGERYVTGTLTETEPKILSISLYEHSFTARSGGVSDLPTLKFILSDITRLEITTIFPDSKRHDQKIKEFSIQKGVQKSGNKKAKNIEQCVCPEGYTGHACGACSKGYAKDFSRGGYSFECIECVVMCNGHSNKCERETGVCADCQGNTAGERCDVCQEGYYPAQEAGVLQCVACPCSRNAASPSCSLPGDGSQFPVCDECENGYTGPNCLECAPGYFGTNGQCTACECNNNIDLSDPYSCNKKDGVCQNCLYNTTGNECERCLPGFYGNALRAELPKCRDCDCDEVGSSSSVCDHFSGLCDCLPHVTGNKCDKCSAGYWNLTAEEGCDECECDMRGSVDTECDTETGQCSCKEGIQGLKCNECRAGFYSVASDDSEIECMSCDCNMAGSTDTQCDAAGQCTCKEGIIGMQCDSCARGTTGTFPACVPCGECYDNWEREVQIIEDQINQLADKAQNIHLDAANLTEEELQAIFKDLKQTLKEAEKLAKSSPGNDEEITELTNTLRDLGAALQTKSDQLDTLEGRIGDIDQETADTLASLDQLKDSLDNFREETNNLAERAMTLSAANLDEALKLVEDAAKRSAVAKEAADATKTQIEEAEEKATKTEKILKDDIFKDTSAVEKLSDIEDEISDLTDKLGVLDASVCGATDPDSCDPCGGSKCGYCGGPGCGGAVGIISSITGLAGEARSCADERQEEVTAATSDLRELNSKADEIDTSVQQMKQTSEETKGTVDEAAERLQDTKRKIDQLLQADRASAQEIEQIVQDINALRLPLNEQELSDLIDQLTQALNDINLVNTDVEVSLPDKQRVADLLEKANTVSTDASDTLDSILEATSALRDFDENYQAAQELLGSTSEVVNDGWNDIGEIEKKKDAAETSREGLEEALDELERELQLLLADISSGDTIAQNAQAEIEEAGGTVQDNEEQVSRLKKDYDNLDEQISEKEEEIAEQLSDAQEVARKSDEVETAINEKLTDVGDLTEKYVTQQRTLVDLNSELDALEEKLDAIMERINVKATYHAQCKNDIAS